MEPIDGNVKHIPSDTISSLVSVDEKSVLDQMTRREYALAIGSSSTILAILPFHLCAFGTRWRAGINEKIKDNNEFMESLSPTVSDYTIRNDYISFLEASRR